MNAVLVVDQVSLLLDANLPAIPSPTTPRREGLAFGF
jgi:hypothetical protein